MPVPKQQILSRFPPVNQILDHPRVASLGQHYSAKFIVSIVQQTVAEYKRSLENTTPELDRAGMLAAIVEGVESRMQTLAAPSLKPVINATGIVLHTGLGRAPLPDAVKEALLDALTYCSLELDLDTGKRGSRTAHVESLLCMLTGAEAACVVNNNAAAVLLSLNTLSLGREAVISRGQLIEIGGSFRIPEVMVKSGAVMREVGTTNKTHLKDYRKALTESTGVVCLVHPSNYRVKGFTAAPELEHVVHLAHDRDIPVLQDLGGGVLIDLREYGLPYEPVVSESVAADVDVITFSGDKVLGGPQSGIIVGKRRYLDEIKANPLMRTVRCDKLIYAALLATLRLYLHEDTLLSQNRVLRILCAPPETIEARISKVLANVASNALQRYELGSVRTTIQIGSGAMPLEELPSVALTIHPRDGRAEGLARKFRTHTPPIIGYIRDDVLHLDFRTVFEQDDEIIVSALNTILS